MYRYKVIKLKNGKTQSEHRIIMENYLGRRLNRHEVVHHKNGNGRDNRIENLKVLSLSKHSRDFMFNRKISGSTKNKLVILGRKNRTAAKLQIKDVLTIREMIGRNIPQVEIARQFNIHTSQIQRISCGKSWNWI